MTENQTEQNDINEEAADNEKFDVANRSLTDALGVSFKILKVVMVILIILFITSGIFRVQSDEQAMILRFGKVQGMGEARLKGPGLQMALPEPINEKVIIPVKKVQSLAIESFWYSMTEYEKINGKTRFPQTLNPKIDGYCLTRNESIADTLAIGNDYNIVHSRWQLTYRIDDPEKFFRNIYYRSPKPGEDFLDVASETVDPLLKVFAEDAIVASLLRYSIDEAIVSKSDIANDVKRSLQDKLDGIDSGITVVAMQVAGKITWPGQVDDAFQASSKASQTSGKLITEARGYAEKTLNEAGGPEAERTLVALKKEGLSEDQKQRLLSRLSGQSQELISEARAYRTKKIETAKANAEYLRQILPEYKARPKLVIQKIYQEAIEEVLDNAVEKFFIQPTEGGKAREMRVLINRDPTIGKQKKEDK